MKKQILVISALIAMTSTSQAQDILQINVPSIIVNEFNKQFPKATDIEWETHGNLYNLSLQSINFKVIIRKNKREN